MCAKMISDINPYTISKIGWRKFRRIGDHPLWVKVMKKRHPIKAFFGWYGNCIFDDCYPPTVRIYGSDGDLIKEITCRSNDHAKAMRDELNKQLSDWVKSTGMKNER